MTSIPDLDIHAIVNHIVPRLGALSFAEFAQPTTQVGFTARDLFSHMFALAAMTCFCRSKAWSKTIFMSFET